MGGWAIPAQRKVDGCRLNAHRSAVSQSKSSLLFPLLLSESRLAHFICSARHGLDALANYAGARRGASCPEARLPLRAEIIGQAACSLTVSSMDNSGHDAI